MVRKWDILHSQIDRDYPIFRVRREKARSLRTAQASDFYTLECGDWVNVVPVTADGQVVMIRQYRHGSHRVTLEIPGVASTRTIPPEPRGGSFWRRRAMRPPPWSASGR
jgi:hypothetical protein